MKREGGIQSIKLYSRRFLLFFKFYSTIYFRVIGVEGVVVNNQPGCSWPLVDVEWQRRQRSLIFNFLLRSTLHLAIDHSPRLRVRPGDATIPIPRSRTDIDGTICAIKHVSHHEHFCLVALCRLIAIL